MVLYDPQGFDEGILSVAGARVSSCALKLRPIRFYRHIQKLREMFYVT